MNNLIIDIKNKEGQLVVSSRVIAEQLGKRHDHVIRDLEKILTDPNVGALIIPSEYKDKKGELRKEYLLTKDGFTLYMFNIQGYNDFKMAYINKFNEMEKALEQPVTYEDRLKLGLFSNDPEVVARSHKALLELELKPLKEELEQKAKEIEYKEDVIIGLTDKIDLMDMRQVLNTVARYKGANYQERWRTLYFEFEKKYHVDVKRRMENYNKKHSRKIKSKLDYIETEMNKLPQLYEIACKLFEGDINQIVENYKKVC